MREPDTPTQSGAASRSAKTRRQFAIKKKKKIKVNLTKFPVSVGGRGAEADRQSSEKDGTPARNHRAPV